MTQASLVDSLDRARVIVIAGTGGVGKTTIAASVALAAAGRGRKTLVLTIDPARRLADALGLDGLDGDPQPVVFEGRGALEGRGAFESHGASEGRDASARPGVPPAATLHATMLDPKPTFDRLVEGLTSDPETRARIFDNVIYKSLTNSLAGSAEYAAMEQVHEHVQSDAFDLVVVDTPPSDHALDFLRAPRRLREFLDSRFVKALVMPAMSASRFGFRIFGQSLHRAFGLLERIAGVGFLDDLSDFLSAIEGLSEGFQARAARVEGLLLGPEADFLLVCGAGSDEDSGPLDFLDQLEDFGVHLTGIVVNRIGRWPLDESPRAWLETLTPDVCERDESVLAQRLEGRVDDPKASATQLVNAFREEAIRADRSIRTLDRLARRARTEGVSCYAVPEFDQAVDRIEGLLEIGDALMKIGDEHGDESR